MSLMSLSEKCLFCRKICLIKSITTSKAVKLAWKLFFGQTLMPERFTSGHIW